MQKLLVIIVRLKTANVLQRCDYGIIKKWQYVIDPNFGYTSNITLKYKKKIASILAQTVNTFLRIQCYTYSC